MKKILSFSLWGNIRLYCIGAVKNAILAQMYFPEWICRYYYDNTVPEEIINELKSYPNTELVFIEHPSGGTKFKENGQYGMLWRYYPFDDDDVEIWAARDIDSRISPYEKQEMDKFLNSDYIIHGIRNTNEIFARGGTLSFKNYNKGNDTRVINGKKLNIKEMMSYIPLNKTPFYTDEKFLVNVLFPYYSKSYDWSPRKPNIEHPEYLGKYVCNVVDEYDNQIDKYKNNAFNNRTNYDDLQELLCEYKLKIQFPY